MAEGTFGIQEVLESAILGEEKGAENDGSEECTLERESRKKLIGLRLQCLRLKSRDVKRCRQRNCQYITERRNRASKGLAGATSSSQL